MGLRFRKSIKIAPGVRMNLSKKGVGMSVGGKGARYSISATGRRTASVSIPGTGISYSRSMSGKKSGKAASTPVTVGRHGLLWWLFIGWWWWPCRIICWDAPKFIILSIIALIRKKMAAAQPIPGPIPEQTPIQAPIEQPIQIEEATPEA